MHRSAAEVRVHGVGVGAPDIASRIADKRIYKTLTVVAALRRHVVGRLCATVKHIATRRNRLNMSDLGGHRVRNVRRQQVSRTDTLGNVARQRRIRISFPDRAAANGATERVGRRITHRGAASFRKRKVCDQTGFGATERVPKIAGNVGTRAGDVPQAQLIHRPAEIPGITCPQRQRERTGGSRKVTRLRLRHELPVDIPAQLLRGGCEIAHQGEVLPLAGPQRHPGIEPLIG